MIIIAGHITEGVVSYLQSKKVTCTFLPEWEIWVLQFPPFTRARTIMGNISRYELPDTLAYVELQQELNVTESVVRLNWLIVERQAI